MFDIQHYPSFIAAILVYQMIPGPGTITILNAAARSHMAGMAAVAGTLLGDMVWMVAAVAGLAAVMQAHPLLFSSLQWLGAGYLCWIGMQLLRTRAYAVIEPKMLTRREGAYWRRAFAVCMTNPKAVLFFFSFFPLFLKPDASVGTLLIMMLHVTLVCLFYQVLLVWLGSKIAQRLSKRSGVSVWGRRVAGVTLIAFGIRLALNHA
ncbi:LysE family translocator [Methylobacillus methanolivorans]|uniref:LysE family translocator n=1 Tax=Methylobacillus methanolivorans TaxID=1848927 RepID=A0ABW8GHN0_9PROT